MIRLDAAACHSLDPALFHPAPHDDRTIRRGPEGLRGLRDPARLSRPRPPHSRRARNLGRTDRARARRSRKALPLDQRRMTYHLHCRGAGSLHPPGTFLGASFAVLDARGHERARRAQPLLPGNTRRVARRRELVTAPTHHDAPETVEQTTWMDHALPRPELDTLLPVRRSRRRGCATCLCGVSRARRVSRTRARQPHQERRLGRRIRTRTSTDPA